MFLNNCWSIEKIAFSFISGSTQISENSKFLSSPELFYQAGHSEQFFLRGCSKIEKDGEATVV